MLNFLIAGNCGQIWAMWPQLQSLSPPKTLTLRPRSWSWSFFKTYNVVDQLFTRWWKLVVKQKKCARCLNAKWKYIWLMFSALLVVTVVWINIFCRLSHFISVPPFFVFVSFTAYEFMWILFVHLMAETRLYLSEISWRAWVVELAVVVVKVHWVIFLAVERPLPQNQQQIMPQPNLKCRL